GTYNVTVVATDASNNSDVATDDSATYTVREPADTTPPTIHSVALDPTDVAPNGLINVTVNVTDASGIAGVTANNETLTLDNGTWKGTIEAANASGTYNVTVVATDASSNSNVATDDSATYTVTEPVPPVTLHIGDVTVKLGENKTVPITVFNVVAMCGCELDFTYDPTVVYVTDVARGDMNFSFEYNVNNGSGWMRANALDVAGQSGDVIFAYVTLTAVGNEGDTSKMEFEDSRLVNPSFGEIAHVRDNGTFGIVSNIPPEVANVSATPDTILYDNGRPRTPGTNISLLSAHVTDTDGKITTVTIDLSSIGGLTAQPMEHVSGDLWEVTTNAMEVAINAPDFTHQLTITATDDNGDINDSVSIELTVLKRGDVNGDGTVNRMDADYISRYLVGLEPEVSILVGDVVGEDGDPMGDGVVDLMDALYIAKYTSGIGEP
ncbi:MAG: cohesin domain-containing protein, partial [Euryarchaeota archaeon]|nr:cohesin domain-containing protein [Euryarchaeota archaeon]